MSKVSDLEFRLKLINKEISECTSDLSYAMMPCAHSGYRDTDRINHLKLAIADAEKERAWLEQALKNSEFII